MLGDANNYLNKKARELGLGRADDLLLAQKILDRLYAGKTRALKINKGAMTVVTPSASVASDLRLRQVELLERINKDLPFKLTRLIITIRNLD